MGFHFCKMRSAFTLIELLVVIGIIGLLMGIAAPAVNSIRKSARLVECKNNVRNIAIAMLSYESANRTFPIGQDAPTDTILLSVDWDGHSGLGHLWHALPYLEHGAIYNRFAGNLVRREFWGDLPGLTAMRDVSIPNLLCPSDPHSQVEYIAYTIQNVKPNGAHLLAYTNVAANYLGYTNYLGSRGTASYLGLVPNVRTGIFFEGTAIGTRDITDGLSNTFLLGETLGGAGRPFAGGNSGHRRIDAKQSVFQNGIGGEIDFFFDYTDDLTDNLLNMFSSRHRAGHLVNYSFADGHVDSITSEADVNLMRALSTRAGVFE